MRRADERTVLQIRQRRFQFFASVHHNRPVPGDRFIQRRARNQQKPHALWSGLQADFVAGIKFDQGPFARQVADVQLLARQLFL